MRVTPATCDDACAEPEVRPFVDRSLTTSGGATPNVLAWIKSCSTSARWAPQPSGDRPPACRATHEAPARIALSEPADLRAQAAHRRDATCARGPAREHRHRA